MNTVQNLSHEDLNTIRWNITSEIFSTLWFDRTSGIKEHITSHRLVQIMSFALAWTLFAWFVMFVLLYLAWLDWIRFGLFEWIREHLKISLMKFAESLIALLIILPYLLTILLYLQNRKSLWIWSEKELIQFHKISNYFVVVMFWALLFFIVLKWEDVFFIMSDNAHWTLLFWVIIYFALLFFNFYHMLSKNQKVLSWLLNVLVFAISPVFIFKLLRKDASKELINSSMFEKESYYKFGYQLIRRSKLENLISILWIISIILGVKILYWPFINEIDKWFDGSINAWITAGGFIIFLGAINNIVFTYSFIRKAYRIHLMGWSML